MVVLGQLLKCPKTPPKRLSGKYGAFPRAFKQQNGATLGHVRDGYSECRHFHLRAPQGDLRARPGTHRIGKTLCRRLPVISTYTPNWGPAPLPLTGRPLQALPYRLALAPRVWASPSINILKVLQTMGICLVYQICRRDSIRVSG